MFILELYYVFLCNASISFSRYYMRMHIVVDFLKISYVQRAHFLSDERVFGFL